MLLANKLPIRYFFLATRKDIFYVTAVTVLLFLLHLQFDFIKIPLLVSTILGTTIALILSFRLSQSYDRWWEARQIWGAIVNDSRTLTLQLLHFTSPEERKQAEDTAKMQIAWTDTLARMLRGRQPDKKLLEKYLAEDDMTSVIDAPHPVLAITDLLYRNVKSIGSLTIYEAMQINTTQARLVDALGQAERIKKTVFPIEYPFYLHITIYLFVAFMSISLANLGHHWEILLIIFISAPFFMLEKAAEHLQDPFENRPTDIPVSAISRTVERDTLALIGEKELPPPYPEKGFYIN